MLIAARRSRRAEGGKSKLEIIRRLKRDVARAVYLHLRNAV